ncbi:piggyBac transposable element-derived protein 4-like [Bradysia coprophila]|uniref:piggyBac transposable element-derived protein 4-like n=1 Tax=Bradysia coprophila TaxID=38358 RepID=UPI00187DCD74|nr:piggyBac transposable element-derived protein 4-like [Bradysia coprophila]
MNESKRKGDNTLDDSNSDFEDDTDDSSYQFELSDSSDSEDSEDDENSDDESPQPLVNSPIDWKEADSSFVPRKTIPSYRKPVICLKDGCNEIDSFFSIFPKSLFMWIAECTNERLKILELKNKKKYAPTDYHEIMIVIGVTIIMSYNRVPYMSMLWSQNKSLRNEAVVAAISRDRFLLLYSKMYFNNPKKPANAGKTYYMDELLSCLKGTFLRARSEATFQSIDECMMKCKARTSLKQFMKDKPTKRGIKGWVRADAESGYVYDINLYTGKSCGNEEGTLGERVVNTLCSTIRDPDVAIVMDRFFSSVRLHQTIKFPIVGTVITNRRNLPKMPGKLSRGDSMAKCTNTGVICYKWQDTKEVTLLSNCHSHIIETTQRKQKDGSYKTFDCPQAINFYNKFMGGVDKADQYSTTYEVDRKSTKWWKRVFHRLLQISAVNSWILYKQLKKKDIPLIYFLIPLAAQLIDIGKSASTNARNTSTGRPPKKPKFTTIISHQPVEIRTSRRCRHCGSKKIQKRTSVLCNTCDTPLCISCFVPYHK